MAPDFSTLRPFTVGKHTYDGAYMAASVQTQPVLAQDLAEVPAWVAYWGAVSAEAKRAFDLIDAQYRIARDAWKGEAIQRKPKPTKDALDSEWRTADGYQGWQERLTEAERAWNVANFLYEASQTKARSLATQARLYLDENHSRPKT